MWVHAYQSHVWNSLACARIRLLGPEAVPGDLVYPAEDNSVPPGDIEESNCNSSAANQRGRGTVMVLTREMMDEAFASEGSTSRDLMRRVVLPLAGTSIKYPTHEVKKEWLVPSSHALGIAAFFWCSVFDCAKNDFLL